MFDSDGTFWSEQPMYFQLAFTIDRMKALLTTHPEWKTQQLFQAVLKNDLRQWSPVANMPSSSLSLVPMQG